MYRSCRARWVFNWPRLAICRIRSCVLYFVASSTFSTSEVALILRQPTAFSGLYIDYFFGVLCFDASNFLRFDQG